MYVFLCFPKILHEKPFSIIPLHKKGPKNQRESYRPVSLTSVVCKVCEKLFAKTLLSFGQLEKFLMPTSLALPRGNPVSLNYYLYFMTGQAKSKAFDTVPHNRLLMKIRAYGINGPLLSWLKSFLTDRFLRVVVRGTCSSWVSVKSGVLQGTFLGPIMFLIYINDISHGLTSPVELFADDMKVYRVLNTEKDTGQLQGDLFKLQSSSVDRQLNFNPGKCEVIRMTKKTDFKKPRYTLMNETLKLVDVSKDFGVNITSKLSWSFQVNECVNKANKVVGQF